MIELRTAYSGKLTPEVEAISELIKKSNFKYNKKLKFQLIK